MLGPNVPQGVVTQLSRHMDILPTVLHAAAGRTVPLAHSHGRDMLAPASAGRQLVLYPASAPRGAQSLVLVHGERRLRVRLWLDRPVIYADGFINPHDQFDDAHIPPLKEVSDWQQILVEELQRLAG
jgi:hypothetical protein